MESISSEGLGRIAHLELTRKGPVNHEQAVMVLRERLGAYRMGSDKMNRCVQSYFKALRH